MFIFSRIHCVCKVPSFADSKAESSSSQTHEYFQRGRKLNPELWYWDLFMCRLFVIRNGNVACTSHRLQHKLERHFGNLITIQPRQGQGVSNLIYSSAISTPEATKVFLLSRLMKSCVIVCIVYMSCIDRTRIETSLYHKIYWTE
jgi:hypothetical protein